MVVGPGLPEVFVASDRRRFNVMSRARMSALGRWDLAAALCAARASAIAGAFCVCDIRRIRLVARPPSPLGGLFSDGITTANDLARARPRPLVGLEVVLADFFGRLSLPLSSPSL